MYANLAVSAEAASPKSNAQVRGAKTSSTGSDSESTDEEERLRQLFQDCDHDGDGYIDSRDFSVMCQKLNMADSVQDVMNQLGLNSHMMLTFEGFMSCRQKLFGEMEQEERRMSGMCESPWTTDTQTSSSCLPSGYESGQREPFVAREISPLPAVLQAYRTDYVHFFTHANRGEEILEFLNSHHLNLVRHLQEEAGDFYHQLEKCCHQRDQLQGHLARVKSEYLCQQENFGDRLQELTARYEERITELHCVIAELRKKLSVQQFSAIREEDEEEEAEEEGEEVIEEEPSADQSLEENVSDSCLNQSSDWEVEMKRAIATLEGRSASSPFRMASPAPGPLSQSSPVPNQTHPLRSPTKNIPYESENILRAKYLPAQFQEQLEKKEKEMNELHTRITFLKSEKEELSQKVASLEQQLVAVPPTTPYSSTPAKSQASTCVLSRPSTLDLNMSMSPCSKVAERKRLRTLGEKPVLGADLSSSGVSSSKVAEHLTQSYQDSSRVQEILHSISDHSAPTGSPNPHAPPTEARVQEFELELERLQSKVDRYKSENDLLTLSLVESRSLSDRLTGLVGQYESNVTAMALTLGISDQLMQALEVQVGVLQAQMGHLQLANKVTTPVSTATDSGMDEEGNDSVDSAQQAGLRRRQAESAAKQLLARLDSTSVMSCSTESSGGTPSPWEDFSSTSHTASTTSSTSSVGDTEFSAADNDRLQNYIMRLKTERNSVRGTILELQSVYSEPPPGSTECPPLADVCRMDLENAVLVQELMALKEEKAELKSQNYLMNREKRSLELQVAGKESQEQAYMVQLEHLKSELADCKQCLNKQKKQDTDGFGTPSITLAELQAKGTDGSQLAQDLTASLKREEDLRKRMTELAATLDRLNKNSESRHKQSAEFVHDLKKANSTLIAAFDKAKKKYQTKLGQLQQQIQVLEGTKVHKEQKTPTSHRLSTHR